MEPDVEYAMAVAKSAQRADRLPAARDAAGITWLIDNADAYAALLDACRAAKSSVWITQLAFDADCVAHQVDGDAEGARDTQPVRIVDVLLDAAARRVDVRILLNASLLLDTAAPLRRYLASRGADVTCLRVRGIRRFPQLLHAKIVVIDGTVAFLMGSPFVNGYWDDSRHAPSDVRRPAGELGGRPLHDLSVQVTGHAATALTASFTELWNGADDIETGDTTLLPVSPWPEARDSAVRVVRSAPEARHERHPLGRAEILGALLAGIACAERSIYIEHQYLSSAAVIGALVAALARQPLLEVIVVLNQNPDVTAYRGWQNRRLAASGLFGHPRVGLFSLWTVGDDAAGRAVINQIFIHSKVVIVDDRWAMVGSANLDGVSLQTYAHDFVSRLGRRVFRGVRNFDVAAVVSGAVGSAASTAVSELRVALWREHLDAPDLDGTATPSGGWLSHWRRVARDGVRQLNKPPSRNEGPRIVALEYRRSSTPAQQLRDAGVEFAISGLTLGFQPSWIEVHLSPNWVRNIFA